jgi:hypothetical protein
MKDKGLNNTILFLARDFGGVHMGQRRFQLIGEMVKAIRQIIRAVQYVGKMADGHDWPKRPPCNIMVSVVEGEDDDQNSQSFVPAQKSRPQIENIRSWDANKIITRPKMGEDMVYRPDYFDNGDGIVSQEVQKEDDSTSEDGYLEQYSKTNDTSENKSSYLNSSGPLSQDNDKAKFGQTGFKPVEAAEPTANPPGETKMDVINEENEGV